MEKVKVAGVETLDIVIFIATMVVLVFWWKKTSNSKSAVVNNHRRLPPGPPGWPLVGNLFQVVLQNRPFMYVVRDLREKYGPIFTMKMGERTLIIITSDDLIHEALVQKGPLFASRPADSPTRLLFSVGKCTVNSAEYGPLWRVLRRNFIMEVVSPAKVKQFGWIRDWAMKNHMGRIRSEFENTGAVKVMDNCRLTVCSILVCICFGAKVAESLVQEIEEVMKQVMLISTLHLADFLSVFTPLFRGQLKKARQLRERQKACLLPLVQARRLFVESGGDKNYGGKWEMESPIGGAYIDSLYELDPQERGRLGDEELMTLCSEVLSAGTDTSATTLEWALLEMVLNQDMQEKLYQEIVSKVGKDKSVVEITESDVENMEYLKAVVKETLRRHPPSQFMLSHSATTDTELGGYFIPKDANVELYTAWLTTNPDHWENPTEFRPERFLEGGEGMEVDLTGKKAVRMMPFGVGRRICPAYTLGMLHINLMLSRMIREYRWVPVPGEMPDPTETFAFTVIMKHPLRAAIYPRE